MRLRPKLVVAMLLVFCAGFIACGGNPVAPAPNVGLTGNWALAGDRATSSYPVISTAIFVNGNQIAALGDLAASCSNANDPLAMILDVPVLLTGTVATDGTFTLTEPGLLGPISSLQITIQGSLPAAGSSTWKGTYSMTIANISPTCPSTLSGSFTAQAISPVTGTFAGTVPLLNSGNLASASVSVQLTQGPASALPGSLSLDTVIFPLTGTMTIQGVSCFAHGTTVSSYPNMIEGDRYEIEFVMDDGSLVLMSGWMTDFSGKQLKGTLDAIGGNCNGMLGNGMIALQ